MNDRDPSMQSGDDGASEARRLAQRDLDRRRLQELRQDGPESEFATTLLLELSSYGVGTLMKLCRGGEMPRKLRRLESQIRLQPPPRGWSSDNWRNAVVAAVSVVSETFLENLIDGLWDPDRSTIKTFFVNTCCLAYVNEYRKEVRRLERSGQESPASDRLDELFVVNWLRNTEPDPEQTAVSREEIRALLGLPGHEQIGVIVIRLARGYSQRDIASELGMHETRLSRQLEKFRQDAREWRRRSK